LAMVIGYRDAHKAAMVRSRAKWVW
jgi:hypothetical protein